MTLGNGSLEVKVQRAALLTRFQSLSDSKLSLYLFPPSSSFCRYHGNVPPKLLIAFLLLKRTRNPKLLLVFTFSLSTALMQVFLSIFVPLSLSLAARNILTSYFSSHYSVLSGGQLIIPRNSSNYFGSLIFSLTSESNVSSHISLARSPPTFN